MCIGKFIFRTALIGGLAVGGATLLWPDQMFAGFHQVKGKVSQVVDNVIDDPVALRRQLQSLAEELPRKIADLRSEVAEVDSQVAQLSRDSEVAKRVIAMTSQDLQNLGELVAQADASRVSGNAATRVSFHFNGNRVSVERAKQEYHRISQIRTSYEDRLVANERDLGYLAQQRDRLVDLLADLEGEYATIESQMWQIDRKIDAIARSERLADTIENREANFESLNSKFDSSSLAQLQAKLRKWETEVDARLQALDNRFNMRDYERQAEMDINHDSLDDLTESEFDGEIEDGATSPITLGYRH